MRKSTQTLKSGPLLFRRSCATIATERIPLDESENIDGRTDDDGRPTAILSMAGF